MKGKLKQDFKLTWHKNILITSMNRKCFRGVDVWYLKHWFKLTQIIFTADQFFCMLKSEPGASLVAQWLRICLPMQGTQVQALVWEDPTCRGAPRPMSHNY